MQTENERRANQRVDFATQIVVQTDASEIHIEGSSKDLSMKGIYLHTQEDLPLDTKCSVAVNLTGMTEKLALLMQGTVIRKDPEGVAIVFDSMDLDSYTHLKNVVRYNAAEADNDRWD